MTPRLLLGAPESGSGKTIITAGIGVALTERRLQVQPFKVGPDYIDPSYHHLATGRPCRNLDTWMLTPPMVVRSFAYHSRTADVALIEGVMGLFDGVAAENDHGSSAELARLLSTPIVLVVPVRGMARSAAAIVHGFHTFSPDTRLSGVILNRVGSEKHANLCREAIEGATGVPVLGYVPRHEAFHLPERHLGLIPTREEGTWQAQLAQVGALVAETVDLDRLLAIAATASPLPPGELADGLPPMLNGVNTPKPRIAVAQDEAFSFTYPENLELLRAAGAEIVPFSPLRDSTLPEGTQGIILCGGFPELYAETLSQNHAMHHAIREAVAQNTPIYAECGGFMYLTEAITDGAGTMWQMVGALPGRSVMTERVILGYRLVSAVTDSPVLAQGETVRGHEFHYSVWENDTPEMQPLYHLLNPKTGESTNTGSGIQHGSIVASYIHLHWLAQPTMAHRFVKWCRRKRVTQDIEGRGRAGVGNFI